MRGGVTAAQTLSGTSLHRTAYLSNLKSVEECRVNLDYRRLLEPLPARRARGAYSLQVGWRIAAGLWRVKYYE